MKPAIGWREWCALPEFGIAAVKCKVDTGAKTSCLHAYEVSVVKKFGRDVVQFKVNPLQKNSRKVKNCEAHLLEWRYVTDSGGKRTLRPVVKTWLNLGGLIKQIELTLVSRDEMGFRMLLGREAIKKTWVVDPAGSYLKSAKVIKRKTRMRGLH
ncbi:MAG: RimK/LysX family protein [Proteobacteria bacterium]|nr:RimK/LysX family protein [Pseudomonadota bacterium]